MPALDLRTFPLQGRHLIEASAGTGKTYTLSYLFLRLILEKQLSPGQILVVTYTEAATQELKHRIRSTLHRAIEVASGIPSEDPLLNELVTSQPEALRCLQKTIHSLEELSVFTIHGFCHRILTEHALESGSLFDTRLVKEQTPLITEIIYDFWRSYSHEAPPYLIEILQQKKTLTHCLELFPRMVGTLDVFPAPPSSFSENTREGLFLSQQEANQHPFSFYCQQAFDELSQLWNQEESTIDHIFHTHPGIPKRLLTSYPQRKIALKHYLNRQNPLFDWEDNRISIWNFFAKLPESMNKGHTAPEHPFFEKCKAFDQTRQSWIQQLDQCIYRFKIELFDHIKQQQVMKKHEQNIRFFDDLLSDLHHALNDSNSQLPLQLQKRFPAALIDEFQDTNRIQYEIFDRIYQEKSTVLFFIGDPKQAIYGFRGADIFSYLEAKQSKKIDQIHTLDTNWRSSTELVHAINFIFSQPEQPFGNSGMTFQPVKPSPQADVQTLILGTDFKPEPFQWVWLGASGNPPQKDPCSPLAKEQASEQIIRWVVTEIVKLLSASNSGQAFFIQDGEKKTLQRKNIAVLVRKNDQANRLQKELEHHHIPSRFHPSQNIFASEESLELQQLLQSLLDPTHSPNRHVALTTPWFGWTAEQLFQAQQELHGSLDESRLIHHLHDIWYSQGFTPMFNHLWNQAPVRSRLMSLPQSTRRITNIHHLVELIQHTEQQQQWGPESLFAWFLRQRIPTDEVPSEHQLRLVTGEDAIQLVTIHKSKGLEYPIVFCPFLWEGTLLEQAKILKFYDPNQQKYWLDLGSDHWENHKIQAQAEELDENRRLTYVAFTRAQYRCYAVWGNIRSSESSALAHLLHPHDDSWPFLEKKVSEDFLWKTLQQQSTAAHPSIGCSIVLDSTEVLSIEEFRPLPLLLEKPLAIHRLVADRGLVSFSSLRNETASLSAPLKKNPNRTIQLDGTLLDFPRGSLAGQCLHAILEKTDFSLNPSSETILQTLQSYGFSLDWEPVIQQTIQQLRQLPLSTPDGIFHLSQISMKDRLTEMTFCFPIPPHQVSPFQQFFKEQRLSLKDLPSQGGFLRGAIDFIFCWKKRFYLIDWKFHHLGDESESYELPALTETIHSHHYFLQYSLYSLALDHYLQQRLPAYEYQSHFGGIFYVFPRGIGFSTEGKTGVFYDRLTDGHYQQLNQCLGGF